MLYLDHAATSFPRDERVVEAVARTLRDLGGTPGRGGHRAALEAASILERTRERAAALLGTDAPERIALTLNATDALNLAIKGVLRAGDEVVTTEIEHNSVTRPLRGLQRRQGLRIRTARADASGWVPADAVLDLVSSATRLVVLTHASNVTGTLQPVAEIGRRLRAAEHPALLLVDAAQTAGYRPLEEVTAVADLVAASGHKGPGGPPGTGLLWSRPGVELAPWREGGTGTLSAHPFQPRAYPEVLEAGTPNLPGLAGLAEALRIRLEEQQTATVQAARARATSRFLAGAAELQSLELFGARDGAVREPVFALRVQGFSVAEAGAILESAFEVVQRSGLHCAPGTHRVLGTFPDGTLRLSFGPVPSEEEVDLALDSLRMLAAEAPGSPRKESP